MKADLRQDTWKGAALTVKIWLLLFLYFLGATIEQDHRDLVKRVTGLKNQVEQDKLQDATKLSEETRKLQAVINDLKTQCAVDEGISQTLQKQNRDQQSTINGCLAQAMKFLTPEPLKTTPLVLDNDTTNQADKKIRWLLLVNKTVTPVRILVPCNRPLGNQASVWILGTGVMGGGAAKVSPNALEVDISTPAWSPISPMVISMSYRGDNDISCSFILR